MEFIIIGLVVGVAIALVVWFSARSSVQQPMPDYGEPAKPILPDPKTAYEDRDESIVDDMLLPDIGENRKPIIDAEEAGEDKPILPQPQFSGGLPGGKLAQVVEEAIEESESDRFTGVTQEVNPIQHQNSAPPDADEVQFSAFYPREAQAETRNSFYVYAHVEELIHEVQEDAASFKEELGGEVPEPKTAKKTAKLAYGTTITVRLECDTLDFEPAYLTKKWYGDWTRFGFEFRPPTRLIDETVFVRVSIDVAGIEIATINCAVEVIAKKAQSAGRTENPLLLAKLNSASALPYQRIFISYSRKDSLVAQAYKLAQEALGNDVFIDVDDLRSGEDWQAGLARAIDEADVFQLFWSPASAESQYCRYEWEYALNYRCPDNKCATFIRPVYWLQPMPAPPDELGHLNFRFVPFAVE